MKIKRRKSKCQAILLGSFFIIMGIVLYVSKPLYNKYLEIEELEKIDEFINATSESVDNTDNVVTSVIGQSDYIAVIEIPAINLKRGLVNINDKANTIEKNIQILESDMPDVENGNFILAGHSGTGRLAFFKDLYLLVNEDQVYIYYNGVKYIYKVVNEYTEYKDGDINIYRDKNKNVLTLTTCHPFDKESQLIIVCELENKEIY